VTVAERRQTPGISIVDYGMGNVGSIKNMLTRIGATVEIVNEPDGVHQAERLILPGVGSFDHAIAQLKELDLVTVLNQRVAHDGVPILGLCLGMHLFCRGSEEGVLPGLGWIDAEVRRFDLGDQARTLPVPHMGWNRVQPTSEDPSVLADPDEGARYYFAHSYHAVCDHESDVIGTTEYGYRFHSGFKRDNIIGLQFHPEKSHRFGRAVLTKFSEL